MVAAFLLVILLQAGPDAKASVREKLLDNPLDPAIERALLDAIQAKPNSPETHYLYGQWAILNHQESLAIREETKAIALSGENQVARMQAYTLIGIAEDSLDHESRALAAFQKARIANAKLERPDAHTLNEYATFLLKRAKLKNAAQVIEEVLRIDPQLGSAHLTKAKLLERSGRRPAALAEAELAAAHPSDVGEERAARAFLARGYFAEGDSEKAGFNQKWVEDHH